MNDTPYSEIREERNFTTVKTLVRAGWMVLEIYRRKEQVKHSDPPEFEEYPMYILGDTKGG